MSGAGRVLAVFAHPDDETYGPGATLARLSAEGCAVRLITMTRGESATMGDSVLFSPKSLARVREKELRCACGALGISSCEVLGFPDRGLEKVREEELAAPVREALAAFRPHLVVTFHPGGISRHMDHRVTSKVVKDALGSFDVPNGKKTAFAAEPGAAGSGGEDIRTALAYYCVPDSVAAGMTWRSLNSVPDEMVTHKVESGEYFRSKAEAVRCHRTQGYLYERLSEYPGGIEELWRFEYFIVPGAERGESPEPRLPVPHRQH